MQSLLMLYRAREGSTKGQGKYVMGDTPSLLYMMHGDPNAPAGESWMMSGRASPMLPTMR